jgi:hypothetical protein
LSFSHISLSQLFIVTLIVSALALEGGFLCGRARKKRLDCEKEAPVNASVGATLGLLAFMLAMTFGVAMGQFDIRRRAFIDEVDAISTAYLRADFLPAGLRESSKSTLKEYVDIRVQAVDTGNLNQADALSQKLHKRLWEDVTAAKDQTTNQVLLGLYIESIGLVMDMHTQRMIAATELRIPTIIWMVLYGVACLGMTEMGYQTGITGSARSPAFIALIISFAAVLWLIADLDRPREGAISVSQRAMRDLQQAINTTQ